MTATPVPRPHSRGHDATLTAISTTGRVATRAAQAREAEEAARTPDSPTPRPDLVTAAEQAIGAAAGGTMDKTLLKATRRLQRDIHRLIGAYHAHEHALTGHTAATARRNPASDHDRPVSAAHRFISAWTLRIQETIILGAEAGFFYAMAARDIDPEVPLLDPLRIQAFLFALFLPVAGVLGARFVGPMIGRYFRHPATDKNQRAAQTVAAVIGIPALGGAGVGLYQLIVWRFDPDATLSMTAPMPGWGVAVIFLSVIALMTAVRAFALPVLSTHEPAHARSITATARRMRKTATAHHTATHTLAMTIAALRTGLDAIAFTGEDLINTARARRHQPGTRRAENAETAQVWHSITLPDPAHALLTAAQNVLDAYGATPPRTKITEEANTPQQPEDRHGDAHTANLHAA